MSVLAEATTLTEEWREYTYPVGLETAGDYSAPGVVKVRLEKVREIRISGSGNHRIRTEDGHLHIVTPGWIHIEISDNGKDWTL